MAIVNVKKATGRQMQEAAKAGEIDKLPNQVFGLYQAIFTSVPSPLQERILMKGLQAAGINYINVVEGKSATPAEEADLFPEECKVALQKMLSVINKATTPIDVRKGTAGKTLYALVRCSDELMARNATEAIVAQGFVKTPGHKAVSSHMKTIRYRRGRSFAASVERDGTIIRLTTFKGV